MKTIKRKLAQLRSLQTEVEDMIGEETKGDDKDAEEEKVKGAGKGKGASKDAEEEVG